MHICTHRKSHRMWRSSTAGHDSRDTAADRKNSGSWTIKWRKADGEGPDCRDTRGRDEHRLVASSCWLGASKWQSTWNHTEDVYESSVFSKGDDDIGCIPSLQMSITLQEAIPVQRAYSAVPKPLFSEVKGYIQELLAKGWIVKSKSPYAAPVVCIGKKMANSGFVSITVSWTGKPSLTITHCPEYRIWLTRLEGTLGSVSSTKAKHTTKGTSQRDQDTWQHSSHPGGYMSVSEYLLDCPMHLLLSNAA